MKKVFFLNHSPIDFYFKQSPESFVVEEEPLYRFCGYGEHLILKIRKKNFTTWEMLRILSEHIGVKIRDIGYAGLKDKNSLSYQYVSINKKFEKKISSFSAKGIKIVEIFRHKNKIKIGHLKGNRFKIRLKKVSKNNVGKIFNILEILNKKGFANYFGYQRFGAEKRNYLLAEKLLREKRKFDKKEKFLINSYQSYLFNLWLAKRVEHSKLIESFNPLELKGILSFSSDIINDLKKQESFFKIYPGDICKHYPFGKLFEAKSPFSESERFLKKEISPTGLLPGVNVKKASGIAREIEMEYDREIFLFGDRRYAWVFPENVEGKYIEKENWFELSFFLPKGAYATVFLEELAHREIE
jgi:tRNA pseudouridine13 synthase